ncbi:MAG: GNAT family N-acetyltransferase [Thermodesulfobacteriota bacterium]|nr:GNAT family N-acetyltransferase [Thermodesulfobacteriota bacterium]
MKPAANGQYPGQYESIITLDSGTLVFLRPVKKSDHDLLVHLFNKMSSQSVYHRFLRHLKSLPENMVFQLTHINYSTDFALIAVVGERARDAAIAVGRYGYDSDEDCTELAVSVRDDWQHDGLGILLLSRIVNIANDHGISNFTGLMDTGNRGIQKLLKILGYKVQYFPENGFYNSIIKFLWKGLLRAPSGCLSLDDQVFFNMLILLILTKCAIFVALFFKTNNINRLGFFDKKIL